MKSLKEMSLNELHALQKEVNNCIEEQNNITIEEQEEEVKKIEKELTSYYKEYRDFIYNTKHSMIVKLEIVAYDPYNDCSYKDFVKELNDGLAFDIHMVTARCTNINDFNRAQKRCITEYIHSINVCGDLIKLMPRKIYQKIRQMNRRIEKLYTNMRSMHANSLRSLLKGVE